jgi:hypothetical protein
MNGGINIGNGGMGSMPGGITIGFGAGILFNLGCLAAGSSTTPISASKGTPSIPYTYYIFYVYTFNSKLQKL